MEDVICTKTVMYDIPSSFTQMYHHTIDILKTLFTDIVTNKSLAHLDDVHSYFIQFYRIFSSEKQVFDSLNSCRGNTDPIYTHSINVALLSRMLGELNHMYHDDLDALTTAALLHDIGKLLIDPDILNKNGALSRKEFHAIQKHAKDGYVLIQRLFHDPRIPSVALMHHERCDGTGYPMGTTGTNINEFSRIVAICDVYAGMIASREYRESLCPFEVIRVFEREGFHRFDTDYTLLFLRAMLDTYVDYKVKLNTGEVATITAVNPSKLSAPVVDLNGHTVNLATDSKREILHIL